MGGHRQGVGRVQDLETPGRERGGDPGRTEVLDRECGVSDAGTNVILTLGPRQLALIIFTDVLFHSGTGLCPGFRRWTPRNWSS